MANMNWIIKYAFRLRVDLEGTGGGAMFYWYGGGGLSVGLMGSVGVPGYGGAEISSYVGGCSGDMICKGGALGLVT